MNNLVSSQSFRDLRLARWYYFLLSGPALIVPYLNLFYTRLGLTGTEIGTIAAVGSIVTLLIAPVWAGLGERWARPRLILQVALLIVLTGYLVLGLQHTFVGILLTTACLALGAAAIAPFSDMLAVTIAKSAQKGFGDIRVRASAGWVIFGLLGGWLISRVNMYAMFVMTALAYVASMLTLFPITGTQFNAPRMENKVATYRFNEVIANLLHHRPLVGLSLMIIITGLANAGLAQFENVFLSQLGASDGLLGVLNVLSAAVEVPCMLWADRLMSRRITAHRLLLIAMLMVAGLRIMVMLAPSVVMIMIARSIGGIAVSFYVVAIMRFIVDETLPHETRTFFALLNITFPSLVNMIASPIGGALFDSIGPRWLYPISAFGYIVSYVCLYVTRPHEKIQAIT